MFPLTLQVETVDDYDEYCHYVAGLVGLGLSKLFHAAELEDLATDELSNSMGLFLQVNQWHMKHGLLYISSMILIVMYRFANYRKQTLFEIIWRILMKYPSHACFGPAMQIWSKYVDKLKV